MRSLRFALLAAIPIIAAATTASAQQPSQLPRVAPTTGLADSSLFICTDSTKTLTRACKFSDVQKRLAFKNFDSLHIAGPLRASGGIAGVSDSATGAARAQVLTTARTIGGTSFNGSANIVPGLSDSATGAARAQILTTARTIGGVSFNGSANILPDSAVGAARASALVGSPAITVSSCTGCGGGATVSDTVKSVTFDSVRAVRVRADTIRSQAGASKRLVVQTTTSGSALTTALRFNELQQSLNATGTAGNPSISFAADTNTGFYSLSNADTIGVATGGVRSLAFAGGASAAIVGGAGSMTIRAGTGASRRFTLQATTAASATIDIMRGNEIGQAVFRTGSLANPAITGTDTTTGFLLGSGSVKGSISGAQAFEFTVPGTERTRLATDLDTLELGTNGGGTDKLRIANNSATGAGDVALCLTTTGATNVIRQGATCGTSSAKIKTDIGSIFDPVTKTMALRPSSYSFIPEVYGGRHEYGFIADSVMKVDPTLVFRADHDERLPNGKTIKKGDALNTNDRAILALLTATVQRQQRTIDSLVTALNKKAKP